MDPSLSPPLREGVVPRVAPKARLHWDEVRERHVLLYPEGLVALNDTAAAILQLCDGDRPVEQIVATLESVLKRNPRHPGANHYYVHTMEASPDAARSRQ